MPQRIKIYLNHIDFIEIGPKKKAPKNLVFEALGTRDLVFGSKSLPLGTPKVPNQEGSEPKKGGLGSYGPLRLK